MLVAFTHPIGRVYQHPDQRTFPGNIRKKADFTSSRSVLCRHWGLISAKWLVLPAYPKEMVRTTESGPAKASKPASQAMSPKYQGKKNQKVHKDSLSDTEEVKEDPGDPHLSSLESQIRTKERTLALLNSKLPSTSDQLQSQLAARDQLLEKLTNQVHSLEAKVQEAELSSLLQKEKQLKRAQKEKAALLQQVADLEGKLLRAESETVDWKKAWEEEKRNVELINEGLTEEVEGLRSSAKSKEESLKNAKIDVMEMSRIVRELSDLNSEFNEKILSLNKDIERKNAESFTATAKAKQTEEIEQELVQTKMENQKLSRKAGKLTQMKAALVTIEDSVKNAKEGIRTVVGQLRGLEHPAVRAIADNAERLLQVLEKAVSKQRNVSDDPVLLQEDIRILKSEVTQAKAQAGKLAASQQTYIDRIKELEQEKGKIKEDLLTTNDKLKKRAKMYQEAMERLKAKSDSLEENWEKTEANYQKAQTQTVALQSQLALCKQKKSLETASEEQCLASIRDLKAQLAQVKSQKLTSELSIANREKVLKKHAIQLKLLNDEVWRKDTEILRLTRLLEAQGAGSKVLTEREAEVLAKIKSAAHLTTASEDILGKEREIQMLKDMLKSVNQTVKAKDQDIARLRKRLESLPEATVYAVQSAGPDPLFAIIQEYDEVQAAIERVQRDPKVPKQLVRSLLKVASIPESTAEVALQLTRKLREIYERLEAQCKKLPKGPVSLRTNVLLNSSKLREMAQEADLTLSALSARLRPE